MHARFEIALWSSCKRLRTWRDKPEPHQPASRGGLKRTPPADNSSSSIGGESAHSAAEGGGGVGGKNVERRVAGDAEASLPPSESKERGGSALAVSAGKMVVAAAMDGEEELREYLLMTRPAEVVEVQLEGPGAAAVRVNLAPMMTVVGLLRKVEQARRQKDAPAPPCRIKRGRAGASARPPHNHETHRTGSP